MAGFHRMDEDMMGALCTAQYPTVRLKSLYQLSAFHVVYATHRKYRCQCPTNQFLCMISLNAKHKLAHLPSSVYYRRGL